MSSTLPPPAPPIRDVAAHRTLRDVVALSILPAVWLGAEPVRILESLAASLFSVLDADLVYVVLHGDADVDVLDDVLGEPFEFPEPQSRQHNDDDPQRARLSRVP